MRFLCYYDYGKALTPVALAMRFLCYYYHGKALTPCGLGDALEIGFLAAPHGHGALLHEVLQTQIVDPARSENHIGARRQDLLYALLGDVRFSTKTNICIQLTPSNTNNHDLKCSCSTETRSLTVKSCRSA